MRNVRFLATITLLTIICSSVFLALSLVLEHSSEVRIIYENEGSIYIYKGYISNGNLITKDNILLLKPAKNEYFWGPRVVNNKLAVNVELVTEQGIANYINIYNMNLNRVRVKYENTLGDGESTTKLCDFLKGTVYFISNKFITNKKLQPPVTSLFKYDISGKKIERISQNTKDVIFCTTNGEKIVYLEWIGPDYSWKNIIVDLRTKKIKQLPTPKNWTYPIISPSGRYIAFLEEATDSPLSRIVVVDVVKNNIVFQMEKYFQEAIYANFWIRKDKSELLIVTSASYGIKIYNLKQREVVRSFTEQVKNYVAIANPTMYSENLLLFTARKRTGATFIVFFDILKGTVLKEISGNTYSVLK